MLETLEQSGADVVLGAVRPCFETLPPSDWDPIRNPHTRLLDAPSGTFIPASGSPITLATMNTLWRRSTCFTDVKPFDLQFGKCGGEDYDLFLRLARRGRRFAWCAEAEVAESVPATRTTLRYRLLRAYAGGQAYAAVVVKNSRRPWLSSIDVMARGAIQVAVLTLALPFSAILGPQAVRRCVLRLTSAAGKVIWWRKIALYHLEVASTRPECPAGKKEG
jgi:succinoglycan biosynthesis protein ExoM